MIHPFSRLYSTLVSISIIIILIPIYPIYKPLSIIYHIAVIIFSYIFHWQLAFFQNLFDTVSTPADHENHYKNIIPAASNKHSWTSRIYNFVSAGSIKESYYADVFSTKHGRTGRRRAERARQFEAQIRHDRIGAFGKGKDLKKAFKNYINNDSFDLYTYFAGDTGSRILEKFVKGTDTNLN